MTQCAGIDLPARGVIAAGDAAAVPPPPPPPATSEAVAAALEAMRHDIRTWQVLSGVLTVATVWLAYVALKEHSHTRAVVRELGAERGRVAAARKILL